VLLVYVPKFPTGAVARTVNQEVPVAAA